MYTYFAIIAIVLGLGAFYKDAPTVPYIRLSTHRPDYRNKVILIFIFVVLALTAGFRYNAGADYFAYASLYKSYITDDLNITKEPIIRIIAKISFLIHDHYGTMFFITSILTVGLYYLTICRNTPWFLLSALLFIFLGCWHESFNSVRQSLAAAILFFGHKYIIHYKIKHWLLVVIVAAMAHVSAIPFFILYFCKLNKLSLKYIALYISASLIALYLYDYAWSIISFLQQEEFTVDTYSRSSISIFRVLVAWVPLVFFTIFRKVYEKKGILDTKMYFYLSMSLLNAAILLSAQQSAYLGRLCIYTDIFNVITWAYLLIPFSKNNQFIYIPFFVVMMYSIYWYMEASGPFLRNFQWIIFRDFL